MSALVTTALLIAVLVDGAPSNATVMSSATQTSSVKFKPSSKVEDNQYVQTMDREPNNTLEEPHKINASKKLTDNLLSLNFNTTTASYEPDHTVNNSIDSSAPKLRDRSHFKNSKLSRLKQKQKLLQNVPLLRLIYRGGRVSNSTGQHNKTRNHQMALQLKTLVGIIRLKYRQRGEGLSSLTTDGNKNMESKSSLAKYAIHQEGENVKPVNDSVRFFEMEHPIVRRRIRQHGNEMDDETMNDLQRESHEDSGEVEDTVDLSDYIIRVLKGEEKAVWNDEHESQVEPDVFNHEEIGNYEVHDVAADYGHNHSPDPAPEIHEASDIDTMGKLENTKLENLLWKDFFSFEIPHTATNEKGILSDPVEIPHKTNNGKDIQFHPVEILHTANNKKEILSDPGRNTNQYRERNNDLKGVYEYDDGDYTLGSQEGLDYSDEEVHDYIDEHEKLISNHRKLNEKSSSGIAHKNPSLVLHRTEKASRHSDKSLESEEYVDESSEKPWEGSLWNNKRVRAEDMMTYTNTVREDFHKSSKKGDSLQRRDRIKSDENLSEEYDDKSSEKALLPHPRYVKDVAKPPSVVKSEIGQDNIRKSTLSWISEHKGLFRQNDESSKSIERDDDSGSGEIESEEIGGGPLIFHHNFAYLISKVGKSTNRNWKHHTLDEGSYEHFDEEIYSSEEDKSISSKELLPKMKPLVIPKLTKNSEVSKLVYVQQPPKKLHSANHYRNFFNKSNWEKWDHNRYREEKWNHNRYREESRSYHRENQDDSSPATPKVNIFKRIVHKSIQTIPTVPPKPKLLIQRQPIAPPPPPKPKLQIYRTPIVPPPAPPKPKLPPTPPKPVKKPKVQKLKVYTIPQIRKQKVPPPPPPKPTWKHLLFTTVQWTKPKRINLSQKMSAYDALESEIMNIDLQQAWTKSYKSNLRKQYYKKGYGYKRQWNNYGYNYGYRRPRNSYDRRTSYGNTYRSASYVPYTQRGSSGYGKKYSGNTSLYAQRSSYSTNNNFDTQLYGRSIPSPFINSKKDCNTAEDEGNLHISSYSPHINHNILQQRMIPSRSLFPMIKTMKY
jgi:hypothetical protein